MDDIFKSNCKRMRKKGKSHLVLICDEIGIFDAFRLIKDHLGTKSENFLSLIYSVPEGLVNPLFEREISVMEKRFSHNLFTYTLKIEPGNYETIQEFIEVIINSNTGLRMRFMIFGIEAFADYASGVLRYLNIDSISIQKSKLTL